MSTSVARKTSKTIFRATETPARVLRGPVLWFVADPWKVPPEAAVRYEQDGLVWMQDGHIRAVGAADDVRAQLPAEAEIIAWADHLILPGFLDAHTHFPQTAMIASRGDDLVDWLHRYTFIEEQRFTERAYAAAMAECFLDEQLRHGVTTAAVFCTSAPVSAEVLFEAAAARNLRILAGKVCMDRHAPAPLCDTPERAAAETRALLQTWHGRGRAEVMITPRFAPTSSEAQLAALAEVASEYPHAPIQSHISEQIGEVAWVQQLFPNDADYTAVYERFGLLRPRAIYGHGIHLSEGELTRFHDAGAAIAHCPSSNFFLGSSSLDLSKVKTPRRPVRVGLGTDVGAGTDFSMLRTLGEAYKAGQTHHKSLHPYQLLWLATAGAAEALGLEDRVGNLQPGLEADVVVLNPRATPLLATRTERATSAADLLFAMMILGDDRTIAATYIAGDAVPTPEAPPHGETAGTAG